MRLPSKVITSVASAGSNAPRRDSGAISSDTPLSAASDVFAINSAATAGSEIRCVTASLISARRRVRVPTRSRTESYSPSCTRPEMVCSWLANSCVCARSVSVTLLCDDSWPCSAASSVLSRMVVTVPIRWPWLVAARRFNAKTRVRVAITTSRPSSPDNRNSTTAGSRPTLSTRRPTGRRRHTEQLLRAVVEQRDVALVVHRDHTLTDAVQQRFPMFGQAGDLGDLQPTGVPFDPPRQQPRRQQAQRRAEAEVDQQPLSGAAEQFPHRRIRLADRRDGQHVAVRWTGWVPDRPDCAPRRCCRRRTRPGLRRPGLAQGPSAGRCATGPTTLARFHPGRGSPPGRRPTAPRRGPPPAQALVPANGSA